ncbi:methylated-DNA--[protein]-cysteine S-methyltransferase [Acidaminobacter sp.]|uniref:methylated-DNA--[protein]-cysteine S-methyltransferase n=1 Tax=Acidaminobacter sp. TaxID=1872102 RepID=UPI00138231F5|nr:methylated-DNA--[protein]-cysteine S-methyltransferase [Acidaminobacter sp.]MDK9712065.1 methylated-DNA--[protein]-cysteine S-methyltransferase [Acidaminobacter sp.]MZQ97587.1 methylated-DNA--[protein]-cysteine S-methyltransferase [Acidaminobacter sp.]
MQQVHYFSYTTRLGPVIIADNGAAITHLLIGDAAANFQSSENSRLTPPPILKETPLIREAHQQLEDYLSGARQTFDLPIAPTGTDFQKNVWSALRQIPYGTTQTYADIAKSIGSPSASRAVGTACGRNPILIITPCHRVIGTNGKLTGFAAGLDVKTTLLQLEHVLPAATAHDPN